MQSKYTTRVTKNVVKLCRDLHLSAVVLGETNLVSCRHTLDPARQWTVAVQEFYLLALLIELQSSMYK